MAKKKNGKKAALSMRAVGSTTKSSELTPPLSPPLSNTHLDDKISSYSLPGSPVVKVTTSLQPSPTLTATSNNPLHADFNPFLIPPLEYHSNAQQELAVQGDWDHADEQTAKHKRKLKSKRKEVVHQPPVETPELQESDALDPESERDSCPSDHEESSHSEKGEDLEPEHSPPTDLKESDPRPEPDEPKPEAEDETSSPKEIEEQPQESSTPSDSRPLNEPITQSQEQDLPVASPVASPVPSPVTEDTNAALKHPQAHQYPPPVPAYWHSPAYYGQHLPHLPRNMAYQQGFPYGMPSPRNSSPYQTPYNGFPGPYPPYGPSSSLQRQDSFGSRGSNAGEHGPVPAMTSGESGSTIEEDPAHLWARVSSILPDIHMLIDAHKSIHEGLSVREQLIRKEKAESAEAVRNKDEYINRLMKQLHEVESNNASEASKYRLHIGNLEDKRKELEEKIHDAELSRKALQDLNKQLSEEKAALVQERMVLAKVAAEERDRVVKEFEEWKARAGKLLESEKQRTAEEKVRLLRDLEDLRIAALEAQKAALSNEHEEKMKEQRHDYENQKVKLVDGYENQKAKLVDDYENEKTKLVDDYENEKAKLVDDYENEKAKLVDDYENEKAKLVDDYENEKTKLVDDYESQKTKLVDDLSKENDDLRASFQAQKKEIETSFEIMRKDLESKLNSTQAELNSTQAELERTIETERESREQLAAERETFTTAREQEKANLDKEVEEQRQILVKQHEDDMSALARKHKDDLNEQMLGFVSLQEGINKKMTTENDSLQEELAALKEAWDQDKEKFEGIVKELGGVAQALDAEKGRLQKLVEAFGEITDVKSKGDAYYVDTFSQLSKQILDLAMTQFIHPPVAPPANVLARIPLSLPSIIGDTPSCRHLRAAYIAHTISSILTSRVFTPFLFCLGRRFEGADDLLTNISHQLRAKSTRKEAIWRQHTMTAAYTTTDAKQRINSAAGTVIEEIVSSILPFTDSNSEESIRVAVRRIVKLAVEVWRYARLEREMIEAVMPPADVVSEEDRKEGFWLPQTFDQSAYPVNAIKPVFEEQAGGHKLLLRVLPIFRREPIHQSFRVTKKELNDEGCVYSLGIALFSDAAPVLSRLSELRRPSGSSPQEPTSVSTTIPLPVNSSAPSIAEDAQNTALATPIHAANPMLPSIHNAFLPPLSPQSIPPQPSMDPSMLIFISPKHAQHQRSNLPPSPLFPAVGEIDGLNNRSHHPQSPQLSRAKHIQVS